jgi:hypothetical protein
MREDGSSCMGPHQKGPTHIRTRYTSPIRVQVSVQTSNPQPRRGKTMLLLTTAPLEFSWQRMRFVRVRSWPTGGCIIQVMVVHFPGWPSPLNPLGGVRLKLGVAIFGGPGQVKSC